MTTDWDIAVRLMQALAWLVGGGSLLIAAMRMRKRRPAPAAPDAVMAVSHDPGPAVAPAEPPAARVPLFVRLGTLIALAALLFVPAYLGPAAWGLVVCALVLGGLREFWGMLRAYGVPAHAGAGTVAGMILPVAAFVPDARAMQLALGAGFALVAAVALFSTREEPLPARLGGTWLGVVYVGFLGAHLIGLHALGGFGAVVWFLMVVQLADVGGLVGGLLLGRHKLIPRLSPGKTWEGSATGLVAAGVAGWAFGFALPAVPGTTLVPIAMALAVAGMVGDLLASGFKRSAGLKDFGATLPGHGGLLDRFDGYLYAAPIAWALLSWLR